MSKILTLSEKRLKARCTELGITRGRLAELSGFTQRGTDKALTGETSPSLRHVYALAQALQMPWQELIVEQNGVETPDAPHDTL